MPTVVRITNKLQKEEEEGLYPFCPLCLGIVDKVNNLLEMGSTIKQIIVSRETSVPSFITDSKDEVICYKDSTEWFDETDKIDKVLCFGCKRMLLMAKDRKEVIQNLPKFVVENC